MRTGIVTILVALYLSVSVFAAILRPSTDVDLPILNGKRVSGSLLHDADSTELDNGPYQLVFHVGKAIHLSNSEERLYVSPPLVTSFDTQLINQVNFHLPCPGNGRGANHFDTTPCLELLGGDATPILVKLDTLAITSTTKTIDYEVEVERYNKSTKRASLPRFTTMMADDSTLFSGVSELDAIPPQSRVLTEQRLKYWFKLVDP